MLGELDGEPVPRAAVLPGEVALDDLPGLQFEAVDAGEDVGVEELVMIVSFAWHRCTDEIRPSLCRLTVVLRGLRRLIRA